MPVVRIKDLLQVIIDEYAPMVGLDPASVPLRRIGLRPGEKIEEELLTDEELHRTTDTKRLLTVNPISAGIFTDPSAIPQELYRSSKARCLDRHEIVSLLLGAGALERQGALTDHATVSYQGLG